MSARDSFEFNTLHKGIGVRVLLVEFHELAVEDFHSRLQMLSASRLITRIDATPLTGAPWMFETFRHCVVFVRLREQHMSGNRSTAMEAFLAQLAASRAVTVIPITCQRAVIGHFHSQLSRVSPMYLGTSFMQEDLLHILGACAFSRPLRRKTSRTDAPRELSLATL
ncbi:hypothetical protein SAMN05720382_10558 [Polaromonas sp. JS666]|nr:hypothetical protein SAMN05720382_10558 [Polaromonas sp. JS666]